MARVKIDFSKVEFDGGADSVKPENVFNNSSPTIQKLIQDKLAVGTVNRVVITSGDKQFGKAILKIKDLKSDGMDSLLSEIKSDGVDAVTTAYNDWLRAKAAADLELSHGDVTEQINEAVKAMLQYGGKAMTEAKALKFVLDSRIESGLPVPKALADSVGIVIPEKSDDEMETASA